MELKPKRLGVEWVAIERLFCSPANPRHNDEAVPHVVSSIRRFGWQQPIVARASGEVIAGNTRLKAAQDMGPKEVSVAWFDGSTIDATAYQIADNRSHEFADWNESELARILEQLREEDALEGVGFDDAQIDELLAELAASSTELNDPGPGEPPELPVSRTGDLWLLGDHRLLCGDSTAPQDMERLMVGEKATLLATDPPYLVDYRGSHADAPRLCRGDGEGEHWDDYHGDTEGLAFFTKFLKVALAHCVDRVPVYQWHVHRRKPSPSVLGERPACWFTNRSSGQSRGGRLAARNTCGLMSPRSTAGSRETCLRKGDAPR